MPIHTNNNEGEKDANDTELIALEQWEEDIEVQRAGARVAQSEHAQRMLENSKRRYAPVEIGKTVRLPIDPVDRPKIGHANLLGVVMEADNRFYKMGMKSGVLPQL